MVHINFGEFVVESSDHTKWEMVEASESRKVLVDFLVTQIEQQSRIVRDNIRKSDQTKAIASESYLTCLEDMMVMLDVGITQALKEVKK